MGTSNIKDILTAISPSADFLALCLGDGRIKIWDMINGRLQSEFTDIAPTTSDYSDYFTQKPKGHLSLDYKCMKWVFLGKEGRKRKHGLSLLILGTGSGDVYAFDVAAGQIKWRSSDCHPGGVNAISFSRSSLCLFTAGADGMVCRLDPNTGSLLGKFKASSRPISALATSLDGKILATAASRIKAFSCADNKKIQKFSGHPMAVRCLIFTDDGKYILSCAIGDRYVALWEVDNPDKKAASCILAMEHPAVYLDSKVSNNGFSVLAISEDGICWLWNGKDIEELHNSKPAKIFVPSMPLDSSNSKKQRADMTVFAAKLLGVASPDAVSVLAAYGSLVKPMFENISVKHDTDVSLKVPDASLFLSEQNLKSRKHRLATSEATALDRTNAEDALLPVPRLLDSHMREVEPNKLVGQTVNSQACVISTDTAEELLEETVESRCMEEKLVSLGFFTSSDNPHGGGTDLKPLKDFDSSLPMLDELHQGIDNLFLHADVSSRKIKAAVSLMSSADAYKFLEILVSMWKSRSCSGRHVLPWIRWILLSHRSHIMSEVSSSKELLDTIAEMTRFKDSTVQNLYRLSGRLQLVMAQMSPDEIIKEAAQNSQSVGDNEVPDGSEEEEEEDVELINYASSETDGSPSNSDIDSMDEGA